MDETKAISLEFPEGLWEDIKFSAFTQKLTPSELVARVMSAFLEAEDRAAIEEGFRDADNGNYVEHEEMLRRLDALRLKALEAA